MTILIVGDANADLSAALSSFPREGDDVAIAGVGWHSGGSAANVATALALLGAPTRLSARVGRDPAAEVALRAARDAGVDLGAIQYDEVSSTGLCFAAISPGSERTLFSYRGANVALDLGAKDGALFDDIEWIHIAGHALLEGAQRASTAWLWSEAAGRHHRIPISLDLCLPLVRTHREDLLARLPAIDILFANELELAALFPEQTAEAAIAGAIGLGTQLVAAKLGARGCAMASPRQWYYAPAFTVAAVDTTGCGDAFVAGFLFAFLQRASPMACATLANAMGALAATQHGAAASFPSRAQLRSFLGEHPVCENPVDSERVRRLVAATS
jgi:sugar/nucleoside kinase (ribokinase family)